MAGKAGMVEDRQVSWRIFPMKNESLSNKILLSCKDSQALDKNAQKEWGFNVYSLIEAAGRSCAHVFNTAFPDFFNNGPRITVTAGTGNNGADAMVMLRYWLLCGLAESSASTLIVKRLPKSGEKAPWIDLLLSLKKMNVKIISWEEECKKHILGKIFSQSDIIIDGIAGTGLKGPLHGSAAEMVSTINKFKSKGMNKRPFVISVDLPSGNSDQWEPGKPIIKADLTQIGRAHV